MVRPSRELELFHFSTVSVTHLWKNKLIHNSDDFVLLIFLRLQKKGEGGFQLQSFFFEETQMGTTGVSNL